MVRPQTTVPLVVSSPFVDLHRNAELSQSGRPSFSEGGKHRRLLCGVVYVANSTRFTVKLVMQFCHSSQIGRILLPLSCLPCDRQVLELKLIALRPVVPSHNVRHLSPVLAVPHLEVLSHNSVPLRLLQVRIIRQLELQVPPHQKFQSCVVWSSVGRRVQKEQATTFSSV